jgi:tetratricopeptide (TPR) repeat protein
MSIDLIVGIVLLVSVCVLVVLGSRKISALRRIDVGAIHRDRETRIKGDIIASRLYRKFLRFGRGVTPFFQRVTHVGKKRYQRLVERIESLEREYRIRAARQQGENGQDAHASVTRLLEEANLLLKENEPKKAEQRFIEIIGLDPKSVDAFQGLGEAYIAQKEYPHARESFAHAIKIGGQSATLFLDLADVSRLTGDPLKAFEYCTQAVVREPNDPKSLDALLEASIALGKKDVALSTLKHLEAANPENQKLSEFRDRIEALP